MEQIWKEMFQAAKAVQNGRQISDHVDAEGVAAAILFTYGGLLATCFPLSPFALNVDSIFLLIS